MFGDYEMAVLIYLSMAIGFSVVLVVLWRMQKLEICVLLVMVILGLVSFVIGGYAAAGVDRYLAPYYFFEMENVKSDNIKVEKYENGKWVFSNGEIFATHRGWGEVVVRVVFVLVAGTLLLSGRALLLLLMKKSFPNLYVQVAPYLPARRRQWSL
jgi:hypothetical protein